MALSIPLTAIFIYWASATVNHYCQFALRYDSTPVRVTLLQSGQLQFRQLQNRLDSLIAPFDPAKLIIPAQNRLPSVDLFVPESKLKGLNENLPHSGFENVKGGLWHQGRLREVKVRYRGDFAYHWAFPKKSFRVKTKRNQLFKGMRKFNLIAPKRLEQINGYLSYWLAARMGLITPKADFVSLSLNGKWRGVYLLVEQLEESTLRRHRRMPGDIYAGELLAKDAFAGLEDANLFRYPSLWKKIAINNHYPETSKAPIKELVRQLSPDTEKPPKGLTELLDMEVWGKFSAFQSICQSTHYDQLHNWRLYFDPATSKFQPIVWDPMGFNAEFIENVILNSELHFALFKNSDFLLARQQALLNFYESGLAKELMSEFDRISETLNTYIPFDRGIVVNRGQKILAQNISRKAGAVASTWPSNDAFRPPASGEIQEAHLEIREIIADNLKHLRNSLSLKEESARYSVSGKGNLLQLSFEGNSAIEKLAIRFSKQLPAGITCKIRYWKDLAATPQTVDITDHLSTQGSLLQINTKLLFNFTVLPAPSRSRTAAYPKGTLPAYFELEFQGIKPGSEVLRVNAGFQDTSSLDLIATEQIEPSEFKSLDRPVIPNASLAPEIWQGTIKINGQLEVDRDLVIKPGTEVRLTPGASILLRGRLVAEGTAGHPINFLPATTDQAPWGAVILQGHGTDGSRLAYCDFSGGSGLKSDLYEFSAMFSVHDAERISLRNCRFTDGRLTDDMVHAVYAQIRFINCTFSRSASDALDIDISRASIENCRFQNSGNDAIDLMSSDVVVSRTIIEGSGDKGISVGEASRMLALNARLTSNNIAVQSKDDSTAVLCNVDLANNGKSLDAYKKNWRYGNGGRIYVYKSRISANVAPPSADKKSTIRIRDSYFDILPATNKHLLIDADCDTTSSEQAGSDELLRVTEEMKRLQDMSGQPWNRAIPSRRGSVNL